MDDSLGDQPQTFPRIKYRAARLSDALRQQASYFPLHHQPSLLLPVSGPSIRQRASYFPSSTICRRISSPSPVPPSATSQLFSLLHHLPTPLLPFTGPTVRQQASCFPSSTICRRHSSPSPVPPSANKPAAFPAPPSADATPPLHRSHHPPSSQLLSPLHHLPTPPPLHRPSIHQQASYFPLHHQPSYLLPVSGPSIRQQASYFPSSTICRRTGPTSRQQAATLPAPPSADASLPLHRSHQPPTLSHQSLFHGIAAALLPSSNLHHSFI